MPHGLPQLLPKLVAMLLVFAHTGVASLRGIALCIPVGDCERVVCATGSGGAGHSHPHHERSGQASHRHGVDCAQAHGHHHGHHHGHEPDHPHGHPHGFVEIARHAHDDCGCHVHVAVPDHEELTRLRSGSADGTANPVVASMPIAPSASEPARASLAAAESVPRPAWPPELARVLDGPPAAERLGISAVVLLI